MSRSQRNKGVSSSARSQTTSLTGSGAQRGATSVQVRDGVYDIAVGPFKARTSIGLLAWLARPKRACSNGDKPIVVMKAKRRSWAEVQSVSIASVKRAKGVRDAHQPPDDMPRRCEAFKL